MTDLDPDPAPPADNLPRLDAPVRAAIGLKLRTYYASLVDGPVPERFEALLAKLADAGAAGEGRDGERE